MVMKKIKCAIYTRKSCEEGLEQDFNSLDAQREACEAYIKSQMHEGWTLISKHYDDGGFSGGTIDRPAFKELLEDIENDEIDIVVVYKVDRLTRSIMDFAKIIEIFDKHNASFVSITQHFNTTTSMGRLTLNILLSFAQFEREVTGERIRDKFEATRKKGLWIFGKPPYGYTKDEHNVLIPESPYAENVKIIFEKYLEFGAVDKVREYLKEHKIFSRSGKHFSRGNVYEMLSNYVYIGKLSHRDKIYEGQHDGVVDEELFKKVQELKFKNAIVKKHSIYAKEGSLLAGLLFDDAGNKMTASSSNKKGKRYRYYITDENRAEELGEIKKLAAGEIENFVQKQLSEFITNEKHIQDYLSDFTVELQNKILNSLTAFPIDKIFLRNAVNRVDLQLDKIKISYDVNYIVEGLKCFATYKPIPMVSNDILLESFTYDIKISQVPQRKNKLIILGDSNYNLTLINAIIRGFWYNEMAAKRKLPEKEKNGYSKKLRKLRYLPPSIIESIINGTQDPELSLKDILVMADKYWNELK